MDYYTSNMYLYVITNSYAVFITASVLFAMVILGLVFVKMVSPNVLKDGKSLWIIFVGHFTVGVVAIIMLIVGLSLHINESSNIKYLKDSYGINLVSNTSRDNKYVGLQEIGYNKYNPEIALINGNKGDIFVKADYNHIYKKVAGINKSNLKFEIKEDTIKVYQSDTATTSNDPSWEIVKPK